MDNEMTLRDCLCLTEIFWTDNLGQNVDHFMSQRPEFLTWTDEEILAELQKMETEGLVVCIRDCWGSTDAGRKVRERICRERGWRANCLSHIGKFEIDDLALAIASTSSICTKHTHQDTTQLQEYLFERAEECDAAVERLCAGGLIRVPQDFPGRRRALLATSKGLRHYHKTVRSRLEIDDGRCLLDPPVADSICLKLSAAILESALSTAVADRWREASLCEASGAYLAATIMYGAVLEGLLLALVTQRPEQANRDACAPKGLDGRVLPFAAWKLKDLIDVAKSRNWMPAGAGKHCHELRDSRNFVHPWKQAVDGIAADKHLAQISRIVVMAVIETAVP